MGRCLLRVFSDDEVKRMRKETIGILANVGVKVNHNDAKKMLRKAGAKVDDQTDLALIPSEISEECLKMVPERFIYAGRDPEKDLVLEPDSERVWTRSVSGAEYYIDLYDGKRRKARISDVKDWALLVDALENLDHCTAPYYYDAGLNMNARDVHAFEILMENTTKPVVMQVYGPQNLQFCINLALVERGSEEALKKRPRFAIHVSPVPPLYYHTNTVSQVILAGKYGIPVEICTMPMCGVSAPVTLAGGMLMALAEHLAGVVIHQLANPGAPILLAARAFPVNMITGQSLIGAVEASIMSAGLVQVAHEGFGWKINTLPNSDAYISDAQTIIEKCFGFILSGCARADTVSGAGQLETSITLDPVLLVIESEVFGMLFRTIRGIEVNDDTLGLEVIKRIGAGIGKSYLADDHTYKHFKSEYFVPKIFARVSRDAWQSKGGKDLYTVAKERAISILKEHNPKPLKESVVKELRSIVETAEKEIKETTTV